MIYARIQMKGGDEARLTEAGWESDAPGLVSVLEGLKDIHHPRERVYYPTQAWRLADRARLVLGAKIMELPNTPHDEPGVVY